MKTSKTRPARSSQDGKVWPVTVLILICVAVEAALSAADLGLVGSPYWRSIAYGQGAFFNYLLYGWQGNYALQPLTMFLSYSFLHDGLSHLVLNMIALAVFGLLIARRIGPWKFLLTYTGCTIGGAIAFALLSGSQAPMVGASGALFGLIGLWLCWSYLDRRHYGEGLRDIYRALGLLVLYNFIPWLLLAGRLAWETHLGGFVVGWVFGLIWGRQVYRRRRRTP